MKVSIIGNGNMAKGIGTRLVSGGHSVTIHSQDEAKGKELVEQLKKVSGEADVKVVPIGTETDEVVIVATPYTEVENVGKEYNGLAGKVVVDITNPVDFNTFQLIPEAGQSGAQEVAKILSEATVVKAFNTTLAGPLEAGEVEGKELDVFIAGDDDDAKATVSELVKTSGMRPVDVGPLSEARHLEGIGLIQMKVQDQIGTGWMSALKFLG
ncbi:NADPH-dependent F420 reductase [Candidatus Saccharibacteria bacterium]|nr:NADPH-dependent F420 reductase [Candidatus Saccharibacteria bacterium]